MKDINSRNIIEVELVKTLKIKDETHRKLTEVGNFGESFDDVINRVVDFYKKFNKKQ